MKYTAIFYPSAPGRRARRTAPSQPYVFFFFLFGSAAALAGLRTQHRAEAASPQRYAPLGYWYQSPPELFSSRRLQHSPTSRQSCREIRLPAHLQSACCQTVNLCREDLRAKQLVAIKRADGRVKCKLQHLRFWIKIQKMCKVWSFPNCSFKASRRKKV